MTSIVPWCICAWSFHLFTFSNLARYDGVRFGHRTTEKVANFADLITKSRDEGFGEEVKRRILYVLYSITLCLCDFSLCRLGTFVLSHSAYEDYFLKAAKIRRLVSQDFVAAFRDVDVLLTPTSTGPPPRIDQVERECDCDELAEL